MFDFVTLRLADRYMLLSNSRKRIKLMRLERAEGILRKIFKWCILLSMVYGLSWNIGTIRDGKRLLGILDMVLEYLVYPAVIIVFCYFIKQKKFGAIFFMMIAFFAMLWHTPSYSLMLVWCIAFVTVCFQQSALQSLAGYPKFQDDNKGKKADVSLTEDQKYAVFVNDVKQSNKIIWHEEEERHTSEEILSGKVDMDSYFGVHKTENPGVMDELIIPNDLDLGGDVTDNAANDNR